MSRDHFHFLSKTELEQIHSTSLRIISEIGINIKDQATLNVLNQHGVPVDDSTQVAYIPEHIIKEALAQIPTEFHLVGRQASKKFQINMNNTYYTSGDTAQILDKNQRTRNSNSEDIIQFVQLSDALEHINFVGVPQLLGSEKNEKAVTAFILGFQNTIKPIEAYIANEEVATKFVEIASIVAGGQEKLRKNPNFFYDCCCVSPLKWESDPVRILKVLGHHNIPVGICSAPLLGLNAPVTIAGGVSLANAEVLGGIVIHQLLSPGAPLWFWVGGGHLDMRTIQGRTGTPENHLIATINAQLAKYYGLPSMSWAETDSKIPDTQSGIEKSIALLYHTGSGINTIWGIGVLGPDFIGSSLQAVIDDEIVGFVEKLLEGLSITDEELAFEQIKKVGIGGSYLKLKHTRQWVRKALHMPKITDTLSRHDWYKKGAKDLIQKAQERVETLLTDHSVPPLPDEIVHQFPITSKI